MRKSIVAFALSALVVAASIAGLSTTAEASELVQITQDSAATTTVSASDQALIKGIFNADYYRWHNEDVVALVGTDDAALWNHFITTGIFEERQPSADFNVSVYASVYSDLKAAYGNDIVAYYRHYLTTGKAEGRCCVTLKAAAAGANTVYSINDGSVILTPGAYEAAILNWSTNIDSAYSQLQKNLE